LSFFLILSYLFIRSYYGKRRFSKDKSLKPHNSGELVVVYKENEDLWLRARIINAIAGSQSDDIVYEVISLSISFYYLFKFKLKKQVELIDKGLCEYIDLKNVYPINPAFLHYYQQVVQLELVNIEFNKNADEMTIQECIDSIVHGKYIMADIIGQDLYGKFLVELCELSGGHVLTDLLVEMNFAKRQ
jgi:hypothetical protein